MKNNMIISMVIIFAILAFAPLVGADDFSVTVGTIPTVYAGTSESVLVTIYNNGANNEWFSISMIGMPLEWINVDPYLIKIPAGKSSQVKIYITPGAESTPATYSYHLTVKRTSDSSKFEEDVLIVVEQDTDAVVKSLKHSCDTPCLEDEVNITAVIENVGSVPISMRYVLSVGDEKFEKDLDALSVRSLRDISQKVELGLFSPDTYEIKAELFDNNGNNLFTATKSLVIPEIKNIKYESDMKSNLLGRFIIATATNKGNVKDTANLKVDYSGDWYAVYSGPEPEEKVANRYMWNSELEPGESIDIKYTEFFWVTPAIILIILMIGLGTYIFFTLVKIRKSVSYDRILPDKEIMVSLDLRNMYKTMESVVVRDIVPRGFKVVGKFPTIKPVMRHIPAGTEMIWRVGKLRKREERLLHYKIKPTDDIKGDVELSQATIRGRVGQKKIIRHSGKLTLKGSENSKVKVQ